MSAELVGWLRAQLAAAEVSPVVSAHRRIVNLCERALWEGDPTARLARRVLEALAGAYAGREDRREEWRGD